MSTSATNNTTQKPNRRINPSTWSQHFGYDQGQLRTGPSAILTIAGQGSFDGDGQLLHAHDTAAQLSLALANLREVTEQGGMTLADLAQIRIYTTDVNAVLAAYDVVTNCLGAADARPPATLVEVNRLAVPGMCVEIDALAIR